MIAAIVTRASTPTKSGRHMAVAKINGVRSPIYSDAPIAEGARVRIELMTTAGYGLHYVVQP